MPTWPLGEWLGAATWSINQLPSAAGLLLEKSPSPKNKCFLLLALFPFSRHQALTPKNGSPIWTVFLLVPPFSPLSSRPPPPPQKKRRELLWAARGAEEPQGVGRRQPRGLGAARGPRLGGAGQPGREQRDQGLVAPHRATQRLRMGWNGRGLGMGQLGAGRRGGLGAGRRGGRGGGLEGGEGWGGRALKFGGTILKQPPSCLRRPWYCVTNEKLHPMLLKWLDVGFWLRGAKGKGWLNAGEEQMD